MNEYKVRSNWSNGGTRSGNGRVYAFDPDLFGSDGRTGAGGSFGNEGYIKVVRGKDESLYRRWRQYRRRAKKWLKRRGFFYIALFIVMAMFRFMAAPLPDQGEPPVFLPSDAQQETESTATTTAPAPAEYIPDAAEVEALAKLLWGEARNVDSKTRQAAVVWCVLNRVDDRYFPNTVLEVVTKPHQFSGYDARNPVQEDFEFLAADVLMRWHAEKEGEENVGRVLPTEYVFFSGDGEENYFTKEWKSNFYFTWTLESPYAD